LSEFCLSADEGWGPVIGTTQGTYDNCNTCSIIISACRDIKSGLG
jgi:hypothetical protein